ncbi:MAG: ATP-binding protein [Candidatus Omnitrophica bacterium]|nr:ATP-binding protein [Candidatus Omnitrophota bacterium]
MKIYKRIIFDSISKFLYSPDIIVLHGARQVGKTYILYYIKDFLEKKKEQVYYIDLEDSRFIRILDSGPDEFIIHLQEEGFIYGPTKKIYVLIDEIQYLKNPSSFLKLIADHYIGIKLIVSGSSSFDIKNKFKNSLVGRTVNFDIFNLSFKEFLIFKNYLFDETIPYTLKKEEELQGLYKEYALYGGYPKIVMTADKEIKEKYLQQIIDTYIKKDIRDLANIKDINKFNKLVEVLASQSGQLLNITEISMTCGIAKQTVNQYIFLLEQTYILNILKPFSANKRSELFKTPKIFFYDTGLMQMLWLKEIPRELLGPVFETSIHAELIKKYGIDKIRFWRTADKKEIDFILLQKDKKIPIEAKLNFLQANISTLKYFNQNYNSENFYIVALKHSIEKKQNYIYPWDFKNIEKR